MAVASRFSSNAVDPSTAMVLPLGSPPSGNSAARSARTGSTGRTARTSAAAAATALAVLTAPGSCRSTSDVNDAIDGADTGYLPWCVVHEVHAPPGKSAAYRRDGLARGWLD